MQTLLKAEPVSVIALPAGEQDVAQVIMLAHRIWPISYAGILTPEQIANMLERIYTPENLRQEMADGHRFWIAYYDNEAAAYASAYRESESIIWLKKIYVDPTLQKKGLGTRLIQAVTEAFSPARELRLLVNPHNAPAHRFYSHAGFTKIGEMPVRMGDWNFDDFIFSKPIG